MAAFTTIAAGVGLALTAASTYSAIKATKKTADPLNLFGGKDGAAEADAASAESASAGIQARTSKRRALRAQSLLASGAGGDTSNVITGTPSAFKQTLGA